jgi:formate-dependent nitrite reductase membrane component NrfD
MTEGLLWGIPVVLYLFLAGVSAGAMTVSASVLLRGGGGGFGGAHFSLARYGAFIAPIPVAIGSLALIFELGSFEAGYWFKWLNLFRTITWSPMSIGSWLLVLFIGVSIVYAYTFLSREARPGDRLDALRKALAWVGVPLGIAVAVYTGILLGAMPSRPFWNSPILALLFLVSALSTGVAGIIPSAQAERGRPAGARLPRERLSVDGLGHAAHRL